MKSDPLQGIIFKTTPVHLHKQAVERANKKRGIKRFNFFLKTTLLQANPERISRRSGELPPELVIKCNNTSLYKRLLNR